MRVHTKRIAFGGMMAALAVCVMCLGGMVPLATYVSPVICMFILQIVMRGCGRSISWAWFAGTAFISILLCADKESAAVFAFLGYYPLLKPVLEKLKLPWLFKILFFNAATGLLYAALFYLLGMDDLKEEFLSGGIWMLGVLVVLGNIVFVVTDKLLSVRIRRQ